MSQKDQRQVPIEVRAIASRVKLLTVSRSQTWDAVQQRSYALCDEEIEQELRREAATLMAREFTEACIRGAKFETVEDPAGLTTRMRAACLTYDQLVALLTEAYTAGVNRMAPFNHGGATR